MFNNYFFYFSKKAENKKKEKVIEDKTFGLKNKKGGKAQKFIQQVDISNWINIYLVPIHFLSEEGGGTFRRFRPWRPSCSKPGWELAPFPGMQPPQSLWSLWRTCRLGQDRPI